jgi:hypothetical protein
LQAERTARYSFVPNRPVITVQAAMRHLGQEIPVKKTKRWERLQGQRAMTSQVRRNCVGCVAIEKYGEKNQNRLPMIEFSSYTEFIA